MSKILDKSIGLINDTNRGVLLTIDKDKQIHGRPIGAYGNDGLDIFFVSKKETKKAEHIKENPNVTFYIESAGEKPEDFKYLSISGEAQIIDEINEVENAKNIIRRKYARLNDLLSDGNSDEWAVYVIRSKSLKYYETNENGPTEITEAL